MPDNSPILSFLVVTHNHEHYVRRCLDSILCQSIKYSFEIIVGDDNSSDNTWIIIQEYKERFPTLFTVYQINSDDCAPLTPADRASYNRGKAYSLIRGKYYTEIDGDDYLIQGNTYQKQVELLEKNPACWLCMQNISYLKEGEPLSSATKRYSDDELNNFQIIDANEYISHPFMFSQHQAFVYRRNTLCNPIDNLGLDYEDTTATLFHLQFGSIIYLNQSGYQYISYPFGINNLLSGNDRTVCLALLEIEHCIFFPVFRTAILKASLPKLIHLLKMEVNGVLVLSSTSRISFSRYSGFIFRYFEKENHSLYESFRIRVIRLFSVILSRTHSNKNWLFQILFRLFV